MIRVGIIGGLGKMGQEAIKAVSKENDMKVAAVIDIFRVGEEIEVNGNKYIIEESMENVKERVDVFLDLTGPASVKKNAEKAIELKKNIIIGATGILKEEIEELKRKTEIAGINVMVIPNFAIGAVLMMQFAKQAAKYMNEVEIIEYHHAAKLDAPSGTAIRTAEMINEVKSKRPEMKGEELIKGARGADYGDINIHSVRLNGFVASQEVIFGGSGQLLKIRHDSINRESFMPGVILSIRNINGIRGLIYGLENILQ